MNRKYKVEKAPKIISYWFTRNGVHIPVYEKEETKKIGKVMAVSKRRNPSTTQPDVLSSIDKLEKSTSKSDLSEASVKRYLNQANAHMQKLKERINTAHPLEDMDNLRIYQQRLNAIIKKLKDEYDSMY